MLGPLDKLANEMEAKWGADRLSTLVPEPLARRFGSAKAKLDAAIEDADADLVMKRAEVMKRGWVSLDDAATKAGALPLAEIVPDVWTMKDDQGEVVAIARRREDAEALLGQGIAARVYTLDEVMRIITAFEGKLLRQAKQEFPGAEVTSVLSKALDDHIPAVLRFLVTLRGRKADPHVCGNIILPHAPPSSFKKPRLYCALAWTGSATIFGNRQGTSEESPVVAPYCLQLIDRNLFPSPSDFRFVLRIVRSRP